MKNKKLFAILTLVCFMLTLMPVAAFADSAATAPINYQESYVFADDTDAEVDADGKDYADICFDFNDDNATPSVYVWFIKDGSNVAATSVTKDPANGAIEELNDGVFKVTFSATANETDLNVEIGFNDEELNNVKDTQYLTRQTLDSYIKQNKTEILSKIKVDETELNSFYKSIISKVPNKSSGIRLNLHK